MDAEPTFEESLDQLEEVVEALERGDLGLDEALARYERGVRLLARCRGLLEAAEHRVAILTGVDGDGSPQTAHFDPSAIMEREASLAPSPRLSARPVEVTEDDIDELPF
jgi:exodeoxyribonuclease VII small subunit